MSSSMNTRKFRWLGGAAVGALALAAVSIPLSAAKAFIGVDLGPVTIGVPGPVYYGPGPTQVRTITQVRLATITGGKGDAITPL